MKRLCGVAAVSALSLAVSNCAEQPKAGPKLATAVPPSIGQTEPVSASATTAARGSGKSYVIAGKTYTPQKNPEGYKTEGLASWYGPGFHGRQTSNGEVFDMASISAAHPTLPLPSYARVTNVANGRSIVVRVNDRGPFHQNRVVDVSERTAELLDFRRNGMARVKVEYVGPAAPGASDDSKLLATYTDKTPSVGGSLLAMLPDIPIPGFRSREPKQAAKPIEPAAVAQTAAPVVPATTPAVAVRQNPEPVPSNTAVASVTPVAPAAPAAAQTIPDTQVASRIATGFASLGSPQPLTLGSATLGQPVFGSMAFSSSGLLGSR